MAEKSPNPLWASALWTSRWPLPLSACYGSGSAGSTDRKFHLFLTISHIVPLSLSVLYVQHRMQISSPPPQLCQTNGYVASNFSALFRRLFSFSLFIRSSSVFLFFYLCLLHSILNCPSQPHFAYCRSF